MPGGKKRRAGGGSREKKSLRLDKRFLRIHDQAAMARIVIIVLGGKWDFLSLVCTCSVSIRLGDENPCMVGPSFNVDSQKVLAFI